jgi:hypothetical protein
MTAHSPVAAKAPQLTSGALQLHPAPAAGHGGTTCVPHPSPILIRAADRRRDRLSRPGGRAAGSPPAPLLGGRLWPPRHSQRRSTWIGQRLHQARLILALVGLLVVALAGPAQAHVIGVGGRASNYQTDVLAITPPVPGLTIRILEAGNQLELTNHSGQEVVVLGYRSEPSLRVGPTGVYQNQRAPGTYANRYATPQAQPTRAGPGRPATLAPDPQPARGGVA